MTSIKAFIRTAALCSSLYALSTSEVHAQATKAQTKKAAAKAEPGARRLPPGYGQLDLTDEQREKVYAVQEKHAAQLAKLNQEIADLRSKISSDSEAILTPAQRSQLARFRADAKSKTKPAAKAEPKAKAKADTKK